MAYRGWWLAVGYVRRAAVSAMQMMHLTMQHQRPLFALSVTLTRGCSSAGENRSVLPSVFTGGSTDFYGAILIITWLLVSHNWWKIDLRRACGSFKYAWNIFLHLICSMQCYFIWHPCISFLLHYSPFFGAGMHSSSQLSTDFIMFLFSPALGSLMRMLTKSGPATNLYVMLPE